MAGNTSHLPPEIIDIILPKLSVKPLLRFKSVSKSWNTIISDPVFVKNHHQSKDTNSGDLFVCRDYLNSSYNTIRFSVVKLEDRKFQTLRVIEPPCEWKEYLCFYEGVILFLNDYTFTRFTLWNPSTHTHTEISHPYPCPDGYFGLLRDPITDDFKVVIVNSFYYSVYSCKNKYWMILHKRYELAGICQYTVDNRPGVCVDGAIYWVSNHAQKIVYYDPRDDKFNSLQTPENVDGGKSIYLVDLRGSLCMYCNVGGNIRAVRIWTKGKGIDNHSWNELMTIENVEMYVRLLQPLCFVQNKIVVWRRRCGDRFIDLLVYNPCEKRFEEFEEDTRVFGLVAPIPYMESLFSPI